MIRALGIATTVTLAIASGLFLVGLLLGLGVRLTAAALERIERWAKARQPVYRPHARPMPTWTRPVDRDARMH